KVVALSSSSHQMGTPPSSQLNPTLSGLPPLKQSNTSSLLCFVFRMFPSYFALYREDELLLVRTSTHSMCSHDEMTNEHADILEEVNVLEAHTDDSIQKQGYLWKRST